MSFKQKYNLDNSNLTEVLSSLLGIEIVELDTDFMSFGSTGGVFRVRINDQANYICKRIEDNDNLVEFYDLVLKPLKLNHPGIVGVIQIDGNNFAVIEFFANAISRWEKLDYLTAVEWLAKKDLSVRENIGKLTGVTSIAKKKNYLAGLQTEREHIFGENIKYLLPFHHDDLIAASKKSLGALDSPPLTLVHNDFCKNNILVNPKRDIRVIDWTGSFIGSVALDLAEIVNDAPLEYVGEMVERYKQLTGYDEIDTLLSWARINSRLGQVVWRIKRINRGDDTLTDVEAEIKDALEEATLIYKTLNQ